MNASLFAPWPLAVLLEEMKSSDMKELDGKNGQQKEIAYVGQQSLIDSHATEGSYTFGFHFGEEPCK